MLLAPSFWLQSWTAPATDDPAKVGAELDMVVVLFAPVASRITLLPAVTDDENDPDQLPPAWVMI